MKTMAASTISTGTGMVILGQYTGIAPHEAAIAVAFAGAMALAIYNEKTHNHKEFFIFSVMAMLFAAIAASAIRSWLALVPEQAVLCAALSGIIMPFVFYDVKKRIPRLIAVFFTSFEQAMRRWFSKFGNKK